MIRGEETLLSPALSRPPVTICLIDNLNNFTSGEREIIRFLQPRLENVCIVTPHATYPAILIIGP